MKRYYTAVESTKPGYLARRMREYRRQVWSAARLRHKLLIQAKKAASHECG